jgi:hypothetical protein
VAQVGPPTEANLPRPRRAFGAALDPEGTSGVLLAAAVISGSIGIPPHLSLPWFVPAAYLSLATTDHPREQSHDDAHHRDA